MPSRSTLNGQPIAECDGMSGALLKLAEAALFLAVSQRTIQNLTARGQLSCVKIGRAIRFHPADLAAFVDSRRKATTKGGAE